MIYKKRIAETEQYYKDILSKPFEFTKDETVNLDAEKLEFPATAEDKKEMWRKRAKYMTLERYSDLLQARDKEKNKDSIKSDAELEKQARERVLKILNRSFDRLKKGSTAMRPLMIT